MTVIRLMLSQSIIEGSTTYESQITHGEFQWRPDPYLLQYANTKAKLALEDYSNS